MVAMHFSNTSPGGKKKVAIYDWMYFFPAIRISVYINRKDVRYMTFLREGARGGIRISGGDLLGGI